MFQKHIFYETFSHCRRFFVTLDMMNAKLMNQRVFIYKTTEAETLRFLCNIILTMQSVTPKGIKRHGDISRKVSVAQNHSDAAPAGMPKQEKTPR